MADLGPLDPARTVTQNDPLVVRFGGMGFASPAGTSPPPLPPLTATDIRVLQDVLRSAGFDPGPSDGMWGPRTQAALTAFQEQNRWAVTGAYDDATRYRVIDLLNWVGAQQETQTRDPLLVRFAGSTTGLPHPAPAPSPPAAPSFPSFGSSAEAPQTVPVVSAPPTSAPAVNWEALAELRAKGLSEEDIFAVAAVRLFPQLAGFMGIPEIRSILIRGAREELPAGEMQNLVTSTTWWKSTPERTRNWVFLSAVDPASAQRMVDESRRQFRELARSYLIPMSEDVVGEWARKSLAGEVLEEDYRRHLVDRAKGRFPTLAAALDRGFTVEQAADDYRQLAARELEISPNAIDFNDPKWLIAIEGKPDANGNRAAMSLYEWHKELRTNDMYGWDLTRGARHQATQFAAELMRTFGRVG